MGKKIVGKGENAGGLVKGQLFPKQAHGVTCPQYKSFENSGKRKNCFF